MKIIADIVFWWRVRCQRKRLHKADPKMAALYADLQRRRRDHRSTRPTMAKMRKATTERLRSELRPAAEKGATRLRSEVGL